MAEPASPATSVTLSLVSHTNAGKTTLARTLLGRDIGEVRDAPHVTELAESHVLVATAQGDQLRLWDTPGFGDSARLVKLVQRLRQSGQPLGWLLSQVWDRWRDRPFWASQQALRHVQAESDVVLYLVNAAEAPAAAGYVAPEMDLLAWLGKPVLVLLNQLGAPRSAAEEALDVQAWRSHLQRWPLARAVLPLDAFARCWVHERSLLDHVQTLLQGAQLQAMQRLTAAWLAQHEATFDAAMQVLADSLTRCALAREPVAEAAAVGDRLRQWGAGLARGLGQDDSSDPLTLAQRRLAALLEHEVRSSTAALIALHGLQAAGGDQASDSGAVLHQILGRVEQQFALRERVPEGRAALAGGAIAGALTGLKADILSGGLTLGGGLIAGGLLGALGAAGVARGINVLRDTGQSWVSFSPDALDAALQAALLRYLAVAHFGRGRGGWVQGEAPPHWPAAVTAALAPQQAALQALWAGRVLRGDRADNAEQTTALARALLPLLQRTVQALLANLYPQPPLQPTHNRAP